jgi:hypothetical protein
MSESAPIISSIRLPQFCRRIKHRVFWPAGAEDRWCAVYIAVIGFLALGKEQQSMDWEWILSIIDLTLAGVPRW